MDYILCTLVVLLSNMPDVLSVRCYNGRKHIICVHGCCGTTNDMKCCGSDDGTPSISNSLLAVIVVCVAIIVTFIAIGVYCFWSVCVRKA